MADISHNGLYVRYIHNIQGLLLMLLGHTVVFRMNWVHKTSSYGQKYETVLKSAKIRGLYDAECKQENHRSDFLSKGTGLKKMERQNPFQKKQREKGKREKPFSGFSLFCSHTRFDHVDNIVAEFFTLTDYVHIHGTDSVGVLMVVDIVDVLALQLVAVVVYLILDIKRAVDIEIVLASGKHHVHLAQAVVRQLEHLVQMLILLLRKVLLTLYLAVYCTRHVVTTVADTLYFGYLTQHGTYLCLCLVAEMCIADFIKIFCNLYLHVVRYAFIFLYTSKQLDKRALVLGYQQFAYHGEHTLYALGKRLYLLACLKHRKLGCLHKSTADKAQAEVVFLLRIAARLYHTAYNLLNLRYEPDEYCRVGDVEHCMECSKDKRQFCGVCHKSRFALHHRIVVSHKRAYHMYERTEDAKYPQNAKHIEEHVGKGGTSCLSVGCQGGKVGRHRGADVLAHYQSYALIYGQHPA